MRSSYGVFVLLAYTALVMLPGWAGAQQRVTGIVYLDGNNNGKRDAGEDGLPGVRVSNGRDVVATDAGGRYALPIDDDEVVFVIKPRDYLPPVNESHLPQFYYVHKPQGSPGNLKYPGVAPTGPLPSSVDFALQRHPEPDEFQAVMLGDPQPNDIGDINHFANDVIPELIGTKYAFGVALGDLMADLLDLYEPYNQVCSTSGFPWFNVLGNHDINLDVPNDELSDETWERVFGPATYSYDWGPVHFITLDNVVFHGEGNSYGGGFSDKQLAFVENDLKFVPRDALVVILMHIPLPSTNAGDLLELLKNHPHNVSLSGHSHDIEHVFFDDDDGWHGDDPHHHLISGATCGIHWLGVKDEYGIPAAMTHCGSPNGYVIVSFKGNEYTMRFKAPRRPANDQMHIFAPSAVKASDAAATEVVVNVYLGSAQSNVEMKFGESGPWTPMKRDIRQDPYLQKVVPTGHPLSQVTHIWVANLPDHPPLGGHAIHIRSTDMFGQIHHGARVIRIEPGAGDHAHNIPPAGFTALFNSANLDGWRGLGHENPNQLREMAAEERDHKQQRDNENLKQHWTVEDGEIVNDGHGVYLTTVKDYGDFELLLDWKMVVHNADSGIYLRGSPQVQIWDPDNEEEVTNGADRGSGALWNNNPGSPGRFPRVRADNPIGQWNSFRIKLVGDRATIHFNGQLVVEDAVMHNFFDRGSGLFSTGPIQLQTHGGEMRFRNVFIREL